MTRSICAVHARNFPLTSVICAGCVETFRADAMYKAAAQGLAAHGPRRPIGMGGFDLVAGGPPCQGFLDDGQEADRRTPATGSYSNSFDWYRNYTLVIS